MDKNKLSGDLMNRYFYWRGKGYNHMDAWDKALEEQYSFGLRHKPSEGNI